jgi:hypothetical protein
MRPARAGLGRAGEQSGIPNAQSPFCNRPCRAGWVSSGLWPPNGTVAPKWDGSVQTRRKRPNGTHAPAGPSMIEPLAPLNCRQDSPPRARRTQRKQRRRSGVRLQIALAWQPRTGLTAELARPSCGGLARRSSRCGCEGGNGQAARASQRLCCALRSGLRRAGSAASQSSKSAEAEMSVPAPDVVALVTLGVLGVLGG